MRKLILAAALAVSLVGCNATVTKVNSASAQTITAADALYTAASIVGGNLVALGKLDKAKYQALDMKAYNTLLQVRTGAATIEQLTVITTAMTNGG